MGSISRGIFGLNSSSSANANNQSDHQPGLFTPVSVTSGNVSSIGSITCPNCGACFQPTNPPHGSSTLPPSGQSSFASFSSEHSSTLFSNPNSVIGSNSSVTSLGKPFPSRTSSGHLSFSPLSLGPISMTSSYTADTSTSHGSNSQTPDFPLLCQLFNGLDLDRFGGGSSNGPDFGGGFSNGLHLDVFEGRFSTFNRKIAKVKHKTRRR